VQQLSLASWELLIIITFTNLLAKEHIILSQVFILIQNWLHKSRNCMSKGHTKTTHMQFQRFILSPHPVFALKCPMFLKRYENQQER
jgi:hypothetical protein